jgi:hypothetical protein
VTGGAGGTARVRLPEGRPGRVVVLEVRYRLAAGRAAEDAPAGLAWPRVTMVGPVRWQVVVPDDSVPVVFGGRAEQRWAFRSGLFAPAAASPDDLERWFQSGADPDHPAGVAPVAVVRLAGPEEVRVFHVPRWGLVVVCSGVFLLAGLLVARLPGGVAGPVVAVLGGVVGAAAVVYPQAAVRGYYRRRVTHLPGFARGRPDPLSGLGTASARPHSNGSTDPHDAGLPVGPQAAPSGT